MTSYIGVNNAKKALKDIYIGVNNTPKEVAKAYIGVNNVPKLVYKKDWWLPEGLSESNVLAHWNFKESSYSMAAVGRSSYSSGSGWWVDPAINFSLSNNISCGVFKYSSRQSGVNACFCSLQGAYMMAHLESYHYSINYGQWKDKTVQRPVFKMGYQSETSDREGYFRYYKGNSSAPTSGIIAFDMSNTKIYVNGSSIGVTYCDDTIEVINNLPIATGSYLYPIGGISCKTRIEAAVFYKTGLTQAQHEELYRWMAEL